MDKQIERFNNKSIADREIDVLFIGAVGNTSWKHSSFGRKIEKVMGLNDSKGLDIAILGEEHLVPLI